jgi:monoamine oxidase
MRTSALSKVIRLLQLAHIANENSQNVNAILEGAEARAEEEKNPKQILSRREILKLSAGMGGVAAGLTAALPLSALLGKTASAFSRARMMDKSDPVLIIGGGVSGLVAAYQLQKKGVASAIYEASERLGGRMFTVPNFNEDGMFCELGGEAVDTDHTSLMSLCAELGLGIQDLTKEDQGLEKDFYFSGGKVISPAQMVVAFQPLASQIARDLRELWGGSPARMATYKDRNNPTLLKYDRMSLAQYLYGKKEAEKWVTDLICTLYVCEFGVEPGEQSALNFLSMVTIAALDGPADKIPQSGPFNMEFLGVSDEKFRIEGGSSSLCNALVKALQGKVPFYLDHQLLKIEDKSGGLDFSFKKGSSTVEVSAKQAICTIPFSTLRFVEGISALDLNPDLKKGISEMGYGNVSKRAMGFKSRFWRKDKKYPSGGSILSVGRQQIYETSRMQKGSSGILTRVLAGKESTQISYESLQKDIQFLSRIYPGAKKEFDNKDVLMAWGPFPWSKGCYSCLKPGQYTGFNGIAEEAQLGGRLLFAGEHTSVDYGGFMNGAIETGNASASKIMQSRSIQPIK